MITLAAAINRHGVGVDAHHDLDSLVPVHAGPQRQGDVLVVPSARRASSKAEPVPAAGVAVVRGEAGGNTHLLLAEGPATWTPAPARSGELLLGVLHVRAGATAFLAHPEHAYTGIGPGVYELRRQREQADEVRIVAD